MEENKAFTEVIGSADMPFLNSLAQQYAVAANYFANGKDSLPNYTMLTAGELVPDNTFIGVISDDNVVRELVTAGKSWKVYADALPSVGYLGASVPPYVKWHNPFTYLSDVVNDPAQQANIVPVTQLATDLANNTLPDYAFVVPDNQNNSHDCPPGLQTCSLDQTLMQADTWLSTNIGPVFNSPAMQGDGVLMIVYDESEENDTQNGGGHVPFIVAGPRVKRAFTSTTMYQHPSVLRLSLSLLGIGTFPGAAGTAPAMSEFFQ